MEGGHGSVGLSLTSELESTGAVYATDESLVVGGASNEGSSQMWSQTSNTVHQGESRDILLPYMGLMSF